MITKEKETLLQEVDAIKQQSVKKVSEIFFW
jgi:hypothetical protein